MTKTGLLYYYYWEHGAPVLYDIHKFRGSIIDKGFKGLSYAELLERYKTLTGKVMMHSTSVTMDNWMNV